VSWVETCKPKTYGGLGIRNMEGWNKASIAKLVWVVAKKKDLLWVKWVHERYLGLTPLVGIHPSSRYMLVLEEDI